MRRIVGFCAVGILTLCAVTSGALSQDEEKKDSALYEKYYRDPALKEMAGRTDSLEAIRDSITAEIEEKRRLFDKEKSKDRKVIRFDFSDIEKPGSPEEFDAPFHFPPVAQYYTSTCWSFGTTSFLE